MNPWGCIAAGIVAVSVAAGWLPAQYHPWIAALIFAASYIALAAGRVPGLRIDRAGIALTGASLMVASGVLPLDDAYRAIDLDTITLLLGIMVVVASLKVSGCFDIAAAWVMARAHTPLVLLASVTAVAGLFSAFLVNDAICLALAPLVAELALRAGRRPLPYLLAVALASNVGSVATITGNPQNIMVGGLSRIPYLRFAGALAPVALAGLLVTFALVALLHRDEFHAGARLDAAPVLRRFNRAVAVRSVLGAGIMVALFCVGVAPAKAAIVVGALMLLSSRVRSARIYAEVDWSLLLMFAGLFIIVAGARHALLTPDLVAAVGRLGLNRIPVLTAVTAVLSNLVSNVPAVLMLEPFIAPLANQREAWLTVAMASTLAGNFTLLASIANLIVAQQAARHGIEMSFRAHLRVGAPLTLITLAIGVAWLML